jgi:hypothetical protein
MVATTHLETFYMFGEQVERNSEAILRASVASVAEGRIVSDEAFGLDPDGGHALRINLKEQGRVGRLILRSVRHVRLRHEGARLLGSQSDRQSKRRKGANQGNSATTGIHKIPGMRLLCSRRGGLLSSNPLLRDGHEHTAMRQGSCWPIEATQLTPDLASTASRRLWDGAQEVVRCYFVFDRQGPRRLNSDLGAHEFATTFAPPLDSNRCSSR